MLKRPKKWPEDKPIPTVSQSYRFVLSHPKVDLCLAGPSQWAHVKELTEIIKEGPLSQEELTFMREFGDARHA